MAVEFCHNLLLKLFLWFSRFQREPRFGRWVRLEEQKNRILKAVEEGGDSFPDELLGFLSTALYLPIRFFEKATWTEVVKAFYSSLNLTRCKIFLPIFEPSNTPYKPEPWDYPNRSWYVYVNMLARSYGWSIEYISNLKLEDALPAVQEILTDDQLEKEFQWTMSERSSYYDDKTKSSKANPLTRPNWMNKHIDISKDARQTKIPIGMMPSGAGITQNDLIAQASIH